MALRLCRLSHKTRHHQLQKFRNTDALQSLIRLHDSGNFQPSTLLQESMRDDDVSFDWSLTHWRHADKPDTFHILQDVDLPVPIDSALS